MSSSSPAKKVKADKNQVAPASGGKGDKQYDSSKAKQSSSKPPSSSGKGSVPPPVPKKSTKLGFQVEAPLVDTLEGDWQIDGDKEWSIDHCKVLYLISLYAKPALTPEEKEGWIRRLETDFCASCVDHDTIFSTPLLVLLYEGITAGALDFDCESIFIASNLSRKF
jgi:hypothetical protein